jgi:hypothetical protein
MNYHIKSKADLDDWVINAPLGAPCPLGGHEDPYNGTGPEHSKLARGILKLMWWDKAIQHAVKIHDRRFHIGNHPFNLTFEEANIEFRENVEKAMRAFIARKWYRRWFLRYLYNWIDEIYYWAVGGSSGKKAYDSNGCLYPGGN